ncbi:MAG: DUF6039 family protein [Myxococcota bacterium]
MATPASHDELGPALRPASAQLSNPDASILHSANCGLIVHRVGRICEAFRGEARDFARTLQGHVNDALGSTATTLLYDELLGDEHRFHWFVHLRKPNDYVHFIHMSDDDEDVRELVESDRLEHKGGGNWDRMFEEGSFRETIMVPQHGLVPAQVDSEELFVPAGRHQTTQTDDQLVHSANAAIVVRRTARVRFRFREQGRRLGHRWAEGLNRAHAGDLTALLYEETWGRQDRLHWLIHLRSFECLERLVRHPGPSLADAPEGNERSDERWSHMFVDGSFSDTILVPHFEGRGLHWP